MSPAFSREGEDNHPHSYPSARSYQFLRAEKQVGPKSNKAKIRYESRPLNVALDGVVGWMETSAPVSTLRALKFSQTPIYFSLPQSPLAPLLSSILSLLLDPVFCSSKAHLLPVFCHHNTHLSSPPLPQEKHYDLLSWKPPNLLQDF